MSVLLASKERQWSWWIRVIVAEILLLLAMSFTPPTASAAQIRSTLDRPDDVTGYQIHFVYVVPADGSDNNWDTNGKIKTWVDAAQGWLQAKLNRQLIVDSLNQEYDITFFKSKYTAAEMKKNEDVSLLNDLTNEVALVLGASTNPKTYLYLIDGDISPSYCGLAETYSNHGMIYASPLCLNSDANDYSTSLYGLRFISSAILHEYFHTLGVPHICYNNSDLMIGTPECYSTGNSTLASAKTIDTARTHYFGGDKSGVDISKMWVWKGGSETSASTERVQKQTYPSTIEGTLYAVVGKRNQGISWGSTGPNEYWGINSLSTASCTITYKGTTIFGIYAARQCVFDIPSTWRVGKEFVVNADIKSGPFWAKTKSTGILFRSDYSKSTCTNDFCFTNEPWSSVNYLWPEDLGSIWLQELVGDEWKTFATSNFVKKTEGAVEYFTSEFVPLTFTTTGLRIIRQYVPASTRYQAYLGKPSTLILLEPTAAEPTAAEISNAKLQGEKVVQEFEARKAAAIVAEQKRLAEVAAEKAAAAAAAAIVAEQKRLAEVAAAIVAEQKRLAEVAAEKAAAAAAAAIVAEEKRLAEVAAAAEQKRLAEVAAEKVKTEKAAATAAAKKKITCVKGKSTKIIQGTKCPSGYTKKK